MQKFFMVLLAVGALALATGHRASAGESGCTTGPCRFLHTGHVHGRLPIACVSIPYEKSGYGQIALFVLRNFNPKAPIGEQQEQFDHALFKYSKITGPVDNFCLSARYFAGGTVVVLCDEHERGWIKGESLHYAIVHGHTPGNRRVHLGAQAPAIS